MHISKTDKSTIFINSLIGLLPFSYIIGNTILNINVVLIIITGLYFFKLEIFRFEKNVFNFTLVFFFLYLILISLINYIPGLGVVDGYKANLLKSFFFLRYLLLFLIVRTLFNKNLFKIKYIFIISALSTLALSIDLILQFNTGTNLFGKTTDAAFRFSGFFGDELIAGSYLQRFSLFFIFLTLTLKINKSKKNVYLIILIFSLYILCCIFLTGNRMPTLLYVFSLSIFFLLEKKLRKFLIYFIIILSLTSVTMYNFNNHIKKTVNSFSGNAYNLTENLSIFFVNDIKYSSADFNMREDNHHLRTFNAGIQTWKTHKIFGGGLRSFRSNCGMHTIFRMCNNHPHNYYIEILLDMGIVGLAAFLIIFYSSIYNFIIFYTRNASLLLSERIVYAPAFLVIFTEIFPLRSSGSFFTTGNATFIFLFLAMISSMRFKKKS